MIVKTSLICLLISAHAIAGAATHERVGDGAYSPKHYDEDGKHEPQFDHLAVAGSHKEAGEYETLTVEESMERLKGLAKKMDLNSDGFVDKEEMSQWLVKSMRMLAKEESDFRFNDDDENKDGFINWKEFKLAGYDESYDLEELAEKGKLSEDQASEYIMLMEDKILFKSADMDEDNKLNRKEFFSYTNPEENLETMKNAIIENVLVRYDKNNDKRIEFQEMIEDSGKDQSKSWLTSEKKRFDEDLDTNHDGTLDENEILHWIVPDMGNLVNDEVTHLFASADDNHDDKISEKEFEIHHEIFVGSEATDYGDHLNNMDRFNDEL